MTFPAPDDDGHQFRVNVSFLLSNYRCIYGCGCPSISADPARSHLGCCGHGVEFVSDDDFDHVAAMVDELTGEDSDNIAQIRGPKGWYQAQAGVPFKTRKLDGACIFANRPTGPTGKIGCSFHHLAERTGRHPADTKPDICWRVPLNYSTEEPAEPNGRDTTIVSAFGADAWGNVTWWCIDTPDAYNAPDPVYRTFEHELRKGMGDAGYERLVELLQEIPAPRHPMPGQRLSQRLPLLNG
jgi:hypothetical protein